MCGILLMTIHWRSSVRPRPHTGAPVSGAQTLEVQCVAFTYLEVQTLEAQTLDFQSSCTFSLLKLKMTQSMILGILAALGLSTEFEPRAEKNIFVGKVVLGYP